MTNAKRTTAKLFAFLLAFALILPMASLTDVFAQGSGDPPPVTQIESDEPEVPEDEAGTEDEEGTEPAQGTGEDGETGTPAEGGEAAGGQSPSTGADKATDATAAAVASQTDIRLFAAPPVPGYVALSGDTLTITMDSNMTAEIVDGIEAHVADLLSSATDPVIYFNAGETIEPPRPMAFTIDRDATVYMGNTGGFTWHDVQFYIGADVVFEFENDMTLASDGHVFVVDGGALELASVTYKTLSGGGPGQSKSLIHADGGQVVIDRVYIEDVHADSGSLLKATDSHIELRNATHIKAFSADGDGGLIHATGCTILLDDAYFFVGETGGRGGVIYAEDTDITLSFRTSFSSDVSGYNATDGGAIYAVSTGAPKRIDGTNADAGFRGLRVSGHGGAIYADNTSIEFINHGVSFSENSADGHGGAIYIVGDDGDSPNISDPPVFDTVYEYADTVTGTGIAGSKVYITFPDGAKATAEVDGTDTWSVTVPATETLENGDVLHAYQIEQGKLPSRSNYTVVQPLPPSAPPEIDEIWEGDTEVTGKGIAGSEVTVTFPNGTTVTTTVQGDGTWVVQVPSGENLVEGQIVLAYQTEVNKQPSESAFTTVLARPVVPMSAPPEIDEIWEGDQEVTGKGVPGSTVTVTFPNGTVVTTTVQGDGTWEVQSPEDLYEGQIVSAYQTEVGKTDSDVVEEPVQAGIVVPPPSPGPIESEPPVINGIFEHTNQITGTGVPGAEVTVLFPSGDEERVTVDAEGKWSVGVQEDLWAGQYVFAYQVEPGKLQSDDVYTEVLPTSRSMPRPAAIRQLRVLSAYAFGPTDPIPAFATGNVHIILTDGYSTFEENTATNGGAIYATRGATIEMDAGNGRQVKISENVASASGGGIWIDDLHKLKADGVTFSDNESSARTEPDDSSYFAALHADRITNLVSITGVKYAYSNDDIVYTEQLAITFYRNDGTGDVHDILYFDYGEASTAPAAPSRPGHSFVGWTTVANDAGTAYTFGNAVTQDLSLYALWEQDAPQQFTVTFYMNDNTTNWHDQVRVNSGSAVAKPATEPSRGGYTFKHWADKHGAEWNFSTPITEDTDLYAQWTKDGGTVPDKYTVTFYMNDNTTNWHARVQVNSGSAVAKPATEPSRGGYTFGHWADKDGAEWNFSTPITEDTDLYAQWTKDGGTVPDKYTVTFYMNDNTTNWHARVQVNSGSAVAKPATEPSRSGYTFKHWADKDGAEWNFSTPITADTDLYAHWTEDLPVVYTVTFYRNDGTDAIHRQVGVDHGVAVGIPAVPTRSGYTFRHWADKNGAQWDFSTPITADTDLYAHWTENGGTTPPVNPDPGPGPDPDPGPGPGPGPGPNPPPTDGGENPNQDENWLPDGEVPLAQPDLTMIMDDGVPLEELPGTGLGTAGSALPCLIAGSTGLTYLIRKKLRRV